LRAFLLRAIVVTLGVLLPVVACAPIENIFGVVGIAGVAGAELANAAVEPPKLNPACVLSVLVAWAPKLNPPAAGAAGFEPNAAGDGWGRPFVVAEEPNVGVDALLLELPKDGVVLLVPNAGVEFELPNPKGAGAAALLVGVCWLLPNTEEEPPNDTVG